MTTLAWQVPLPAGYRLADVLAFHGRDSEGMAEQVQPDHLRKGIMHNGLCVLLEIGFAPQQADCRAGIDGEIEPAAMPALAASLQHCVRNMLGLQIDPQPFAQLAARDRLMAPLVQAHAGLRIMQSATPFEALTWAIIGQQINLAFAIALRRTFILLAGCRHSSGLWCYPEAQQAAQLEAEQLTSRKFSRAKADTLLRLARLVSDGSLSLALPADGDVAPLSQALLAVKGIGPWTVNYALLRGYGHADCSLHGDVAVRAALQKLLGEEAKPDLARTEQWLRQYAPQRTMACAHLWASLKD